MGREEFRKHLLEEKVFNELKDSYIKNIEVMRNQYKNYDIDFTNVYRRIVNYQVKKYGQSLHTSNNYFHSMEECIKLSNKSNKRKNKNR